MKEYGSISLNELNKLELDWFVNQIKDMSPKVIIKQFRKNLISLSEYETTNGLKKDYKFRINLIGEFRHRIVHKQGVITDKGIFIEDIITSLGSVKKCDRQIYEDEINMYLPTNENNETVIHLLGIPDNTGFKLYDMFTPLFEGLLTYSMLLKTLLKQNLNK